MSESENNNRDIVTQIQRFTASSISMLSLLQVASNKDNLEDNRKTKERFTETSQKFIDSLKNSDETFDYTRFIKKAYSTLKTEIQCKQLREKDRELFNVRDKENRIITILPGIDLKYGYTHLEEKEQTQFWQYMYLFTDSVFCMIRNSNTIKFNKHSHVVETLNFIELEMGKTGIIFNNQIFNPFIGINNESTNGYSVNEMFTKGELPKEHHMSIESVLSMLGVDKMFNETKLNDELKGIGEKQIDEATEKIINLLGATNNPEVKDVCNILIQDIVNNFKENGLANIGDTLKIVAENAKKNIEIGKMKKTAESMKHFMANSQEKMKDMKDANGNPLGQQLMNTMSLPMNFMNLMNTTSHDKV